MRLLSMSAEARQGDDLNEATMTSTLESALNALNISKVSS